MCSWPGKFPFRKQQLVKLPKMLLHNLQNLINIMKKLFGCIYVVFTLQREANKHQSQRITSQLRKWALAEVCPLSAILLCLIFGFLFYFDMSNVLVSYSEKWSMYYLTITWVWKGPILLLAVFSFLKYVQ